MTRGVALPRPGPAQPDLPEPDPSMTHLSDRSSWGILARPTTPTFRKIWQRGQMFIIMRSRGGSPLALTNTNVIRQPIDTRQWFDASVKERIANYNSSRRWVGMRIAGGEAITIPLSSVKRLTITLSPLHSRCQSCR